MSDLDKQRADHEARLYTGDIRAATRYSNAVDRYLGAVAYHETNPPAGGVVTARTQEVTIRQSTGVVVVGVDDTPTSDTAVDHAAIEAELRGWDLRLLHVQHAGAARYPARDQGARLLERLIDRVHAYSPTVAVTSRIAVGAAATLLLSDAQDASLVVVGHRHSAVGLAFGLSVGERVAAHHTGPVLVVRVPGWPPGPDFGARPIVVGVDDSPTSERVIDFAIGEARARGCDLIMVHAAGVDSVPEDRLESSDGVLIHRRVVSGDPSAELINASGSAAAVVVGRRGPGGFPGSLLGSVSRSMVQNAHCPVFLVA
jgi:nucleotide-binding universal stress UspA family protein